MLHRSGPLALPAPPVRRLTHASAVAAANPRDASRAGLWPAAPVRAVVYEGLLGVGRALGPPPPQWAKHPRCAGSPATPLPPPCHPLASQRKYESAPLLLVFFTASTIASVAALVCLRRVGDAKLGLAYAFVLPATLLAFLRPVPLPFSWVAPPEPLTGYHACIAAGMSVALLAYHAGGQTICVRRRQRTVRGGRGAVPGAIAPQESNSAL